MAQTYRTEQVAKETQQAQKLADGKKAVQFDPIADENEIWALALTPLP